MKHLRQNILIYIGLAVIVSATYFNSIYFSFLNWDDNLHIYANSLVNQFSFASFWQNLTPDLKHTWFTHLIWGMLYKYGNGSPLPFHLFNILIHLCNCILVFHLCKKLITNHTLCIAAALLFAIHPVHTEAIAWASALKDLLFSFFALLSLNIYMAFLAGKKPGYIFVVLILFYLSVSSKIQAFSIPFLFLIIEKFKYKHIEIRSIIFAVSLVFTGLQNYVFAILFFITYLILIYLGVNLSKITDLVTQLKTRIRLFLKIKINFYIALTTVILILLFVVLFPYFDYSAKMRSFINILTGYWGAERELTSFTLWERILMSGYALTYYIKAVVILFIGYIPIHPYPDFTLSDTKFIYTLHLAVYPIIIAVVIWLKRTKTVLKNVRRDIFFWGLFFIFNVALVLHYIPIQGRLIVADRYVYLGSLGLIVIVLLALYEFLKKYLKIFWILVVLFMLTYVSSSFQYTAMWQNSFTLYNYVLLKRPTISFAYNNRALIKKANNDMAGAIADFDLAIKYDKNNADAYYNKALIYNDNGNYDAAIEGFTKAIACSKIKDPDYYTSRGWSKYLKNNYYEALLDFTSALLVDSLHALSYSNRSLVKFKTGDIPGAFADIEKAIEISPDMSDAYNNRGWYKLSSYDRLGAIIDFQQAFSLNPKSTNACMNLAWTYFLSKNYRSAAYYYNKTTTIDPQNANAFLYMGYSHLNLNDKDAACFYFNKSATLGNTEAGNNLRKFCE